MFKSIAVVAAFVSTAAFAAPSFDAYVKQNTESFVEYGVGASYESIRLDVESDETNSLYITTGISEKIALGNGFSFTPKAEYGIDLDKSLNKTGHTVNFQGMFGYAVSDDLSVRVGAQYRFREANDQARIKAGVNYQVSESLNVDYDLELRDNMTRGEFTTDLSAYRVRNELTFTATAVPFVEPFATLGHTTSWGATPADTYAVVGLSVAF